MNKRLTPERLAEIRADVEAGKHDYYHGGCAAVMRLLLDHCEVTDHAVRRAQASILSGSRLLNDPVPETCADALAKWDKGEAVFTVEMGGIGPGYEQTIHILVFELLRDEMGKALPTDATWGDWGAATIHRTNEALGRWGYSSAQVGAAKQLAFRALRDGWRVAVRSVPDDRHIQVMRGFLSELPVAMLTPPQGHECT